MLLYPSVSNYWNSFHQSQAIASYVDAVDNLDEADYSRLLSDAQAYNASLLSKSNRYKLSDAEYEEYESLLNISGNGIMGYIEIPSISCTLPIYHGTDASILQIAAGHIEGTSLPVGGEGTHCVLSGHRGLPSAQLFTNLDKLVEGDLFVIRVLDETLTYEVDQILIVDPDDMDPLAIEEGKDYCTLVTCTPYGVNTQRLLVRGHRVANQPSAGDIRITTEAVQIDTNIVAVFIGVIILLVLLLWGLIRNHRRSGRSKRRE